MFLTTRSRNKIGCVGNNRRAVAATELAVCLPMIVFLTMAAIETCAMLNLKKSIAIASYEGARVALIPGATNNNVVTQCNQILDDRRVKNAIINVAPNVQTAAPGTFVNVQIEAPCDGNGPLPSMIFRGRKFISDVSMMKEL
jgi:hypothetical protein